MVRARVLPAYLSADGVALVPAWALTRVDEHLVPVEAVQRAWAALPHGGLLADVDLVAWVETRRHDLDGATPLHGQPPMDTTTGWPLRCAACAAARVTEPRSAHDLLDEGRSAALFRAADGLCSEG